MRGVCLPRPSCSEVTSLIPIQLTQDVIADLAWQGAIGLMVLDAAKDLGRGEVAALVDEGLPHEVVGGVVKALGGEGRRVDGGKAQVRSGVDLLLNQRHRCPPLCPCAMQRQCARSCAWPGAAQSAAQSAAP